MKLFNRWDYSGIQVEEEGLKRYITLSPLLVPKTGGRNIKTQFWKSKNNIIERLINKIMGPGHQGKKHKRTSRSATGKSLTAVKILKEVFEIIEKRLNKNPIEVFVKAVENAAPREEITTIEYGGARYPQSVDCSPQRRIDLALKLMVQGSFAASFGKKKSFKEALADEIIKAYNMDHGSTAIAKKLELERQADASR